MRIFVKHLNTSFLLKCCLASLHNIFTKGGEEKSFHPSFLVTLLHKWGFNWVERAKGTSFLWCQMWHLAPFAAALTRSVEALEILPSQKTFSLLSQASFAPCRLQNCFSKPFHVCWIFQSQSCTYPGCCWKLLIYVALAITSFQNLVISVFINGAGVAISPCFCLMCRSCRTII